MGIDKTVLVVDDKEFNVEILTDILEDIGYKVLPAYNGEEALNILKTNMPDAILLDIMMPGMSGFDVCEKIKQEELYAQIPIIFISALDSIDNKVKGLDIGGNDYITKPFNPDEVVARTGVAIRLKDMQDKINKQAIELKRKNDLIENELRIAMKIQKNLLPISLVDYLDQETHVHYNQHDILVSGCYIPCDSLGGDLYDVTVENNKLFASIVDVSGHGAPSSLITIMYKMLFNEYTEQHDEPSKIVQIINDKLYKLVFTQYYATAIIGCLDLETKQFSYVRAGHPYPLIYKKVTDNIVMLKEGSMPLAMFEHVPFQDFQIQLEKGDKILLYTDGLTDAFVTDELESGEDVLAKVFLESIHQKTVNAIGDILDCLSQSAVNETILDDRTILLIEVN